MYAIRRARSASDFEDIRDIHIRIFAGGEREIPDLTGAWWLLVYNNRPVGFCGIHLSSNWQKTAYLCRVGILERHTGKGLHKRLIRVREKWARKQNIAWIVTDTASDNYPSANSLIKCGYRLWDPPQRARWVTYPKPLYWFKKLI